MIKTARILLALALSSGALRADDIVQEGSLSGNKGGPDFHAIALDQFDSAGGTRVLNFVKIDLLTSTAGGGTTTGSGIPVDIDVTLAADYLLGPLVLSETEAVIDATIPNTGSPSSFSVFDTDTDQVLIDQPAGMAPWMGPGQIMLTGITEFHITLTPPDEIDFSAGGTVRYTVTYDFSVTAPVPALPTWGLLAMVLAMMAFGGSVLRSRAVADQ